MPTGTELHTILVGVDGSEAGARALAWAAARAREAGADVVAVHVLTFSEQFRRDISFETMTTWRRERREQLDGEWTEPARGGGVRVSTSLAEADSPAGGLLDSAARLDADLIVLGVHSRGGLADRLLGATTYEVAHRARIPVVIIPREG
jgi:nucleotide-binding universal stress UspA family protein